MNAEWIADILQIIFADIILSGDNALVIGMAAAGLPPALRTRAIAIGMALAAGLRILSAVTASLLLQVPGVLFLGGLLLAWVCWRFYRELREAEFEMAESALERSVPVVSQGRQMWNALVTITIADVSMSIDNVVAVAAIAREDTALLVFGLALAIAFMAFFATIIMRVMTRFPLLAWAGLFFLVYLTWGMLHDGWPEMAELLGFAAGGAT